MNILAQGAVLFLSREELTAAHLTPETLTEEGLFPLICRTLQQAGQPVPLRPEVCCFPDPGGVLIFLRPRVEEPRPDCCVSVTFS